MTSAVGLSLVATAVFGAGGTLSPSIVESVDVDSEIFCLAQNIYFESRDQPLAGRLAVAFVTLNRVSSNKFPDTICDVVYQAKTKPSWKTGLPVPIRNQCQFSWYCDGKADLAHDTVMWQDSVSIANNVYSIHIDDEYTYDDITEGSTYYHANYVSPYWRHSLNYTVTIEDHVFYTDN